MDDTMCDRQTNSFCVVCVCNRTAQPYFRVYIKFDEWWRWNIVFCLHIELTGLLFLFYVHEITWRGAQTTTANKQNNETLK